MGATPSRAGARPEPPTKAHRSVPGHDINLPCGHARTLRSRTPWALIAGVSAVTAGLALAAGPAPGAVTTTNVAGTPQGIALGDSSVAYATDLGSDSVMRISLPAVTVSPGWAQVGDGPFDIAVDADGYIYTANSSSDGVTRVSPSGTSSGAAPHYQWAATGDQPSALAISSTDAIFTANTAGNSVTRITPDGTTSGFSPAFLWAPAGLEPRGIAVGPDGTVYVANNLSNGITRIGSDGSASGSTPLYQWAPTGTRPFSLALDWAGNVFTVNPITSPPSVTKVTAQGASTQTWATLPANGAPEDAVIDSGGNIYVVNTDLDSVTQVRPDATTAFVSTTGDRPVAIALDSAGNLYTANAGDGITGGSITKISPGGGVPDIAPAPPAVPAAPSVTTSGASATITVPPNAASSRYGTPTSYIVAAVGNPGVTCTITAPATTCSVQGLTLGAGYSFTAQAKLNAWETTASPPSAVVTPAADPAPDPPDPGQGGTGPGTGPASGGGQAGGAGSGTASGPSMATTARLPGAWNLRRGVGTTTGTVPRGATRITQTARTGGGAATQGFLEMARAKQATGRCTITKRKYRCTIRLSKGTWTVTTTARGKAGVVAQGTRRVVVR